PSHIHQQTGAPSGPNQGSPDVTTTDLRPTAQPLNPRPSFVCHYPSATNRDGYTKKQLAPLPID
ncbi:hypothetical protein BD309DRAFT_823092, partial [Dichomitus squalens]